MPPKIEYRLATLDDLKNLEEVGDDLFDNNINRKRAIEFLNDPRHHLFLAYLNGKVIGMASGFHFVHPDKEPALFVNEVGVLDEFQNKGIGRMLVKKLVEYGKKIGCAEAWVATEHSNVKARKAYRAAGGVEDKEPVVLINFPY